MAKWVVFFLFSEKIRSEMLQYHNKDFWITTILKHWLADTILVRWPYAKLKMPCTPNIMYIIGADCNLYFKSRTGLQLQVWMKMSTASTCNISTWHILEHLHTKYSFHWPDDTVIFFVKEGKTVRAKKRGHIISIVKHPSYAECRFWNPWTRL